MLGTLALAAACAVGIVALMMVLAGTFKAKVKGGLPAEVTSAAAKPQETVVVRAVRRPRRESAVGTVRAVHEAVVASKILARVEEVRVRAGQEVKQGDVLVVLDDADLKSRLEQASAAESAARARWEQAEGDRKRFEDLRVGTTVSQSELDRVNAAARTAKADLDRARRAVEEARIVEAYATVRAPMGGRVIDKKVNEGDTVSQGQPLLTMYDPSHMQLVATVRESLAMRLKVGQEIPARLDTFDYDCVARVSEVVPEAQAESRSFEVKVTGPCPPNVYSGMFGRIFIPVEDEEVLVVPEPAVRRVGQLDEVDVVEDGHDRRRLVQLGRALDEGREVLAGLAAGERVALPRRPTKRSDRDGDRHLEDSEPVPLHDRTSKGGRP
jgi:RND family efflux transporter MFP subunit